MNAMAVINILPRWVLVILPNWAIDKTQCLVTDWTLSGH